MSPSPLCMIDRSPLLLISSMSTDAGSTLKLGALVGHRARDFVQQES